MITAAKHTLMSWLVGRYVDGKLRSAFRGIWCSGALPEGDESLIMYANHSNFWDGFATHAFLRHQRRDGYALMEEPQLARYRFLRHLGAFSIRRGDARSTIETFKYATKLLAKPRTAICIFPEGVLEARPRRPLRLERGVEVLAKRAGVRCVPVAMQFAFYEHEYPDLVLHVGNAHAPEGPEDMSARLETLMNEQAQLKNCTGLTPMLRGRRSVAERWDAVRRLA